MADRKTSTAVALSPFLASSFTTIRSELGWTTAASEKNAPGNLTAGSEAVGKNSLPNPLCRRHLPCKPILAQGGDCG